MSVTQNHCCCSSHEPSNSPHNPSACQCGEGGIDLFDHLPKASISSRQIPPLICSGQETFAMTDKRQLTPEAAAIWELHKEVLDATMDHGWDNKVHPWSRAMQNFWKYPLAFSTYAIPSVALIDPSKYEEVCLYLRKSLLLFKDSPVWDGWFRQGYGDPISKSNIMYKGHLNLIYGLYQLVSGSDEFEAEFKQLTDIIVREYETNMACDTPYMGICCEPDQYFCPCNSIPMPSMKIHDILFNTDYDETYSRKENAFLNEKLSDKDSGLFFLKYHPSHDHAEAYLGGFANAWTLCLIHRYDKPRYEKAYKLFIQYFSKDLLDGQVCCIRELPYYDDISTAIEESMGTFYAAALAKEYDDPAAWERFQRYMLFTYGAQIQNGIMRLTKATPTDSTFVQNYLFYGTLHTSWDSILNYDWKSLWRKGGKRL